MEEQRDILFARRQAEGALVVVLDDEEAGHAAVDLRSGATVGMWVVPVRPGAFRDLEAVLPFAAWADQVGGIAVRFRGHGESMPVDVRGFGQAVLEA